MVVCAPDVAEAVADDDATAATLLDVAAAAGCVDVSRTVEEDDVATDTLGAGVAAAECGAVTAAEAQVDLVVSAATGEAEARRRSVTGLLGV